MFEYGISAKWLELLKEISPGVKRVAVLREPTRLARFLAVTTKPPSPARDWWRRRPRRTDRISQRSRQLLDPIFASRSCTDGNASAFTTSSCSLSTMGRAVRIDPLRESGCGELRTDGKCPLNLPLDETAAS
jgi:hypothetical protein